MGSEIFVALVIELVGLRFSHFTAQPGVFLFLIQHQQQLTGLHQIALGDLQLIDATTGLGCQGHQVLGFQGADGLDVFGELNLFDGRFLNRKRLKRGTPTTGQ